MICPQCQSESCRRSRRQGFNDFAISILRMRPWRCRACDLRFFAWTVPMEYLPYVHCMLCGNLDLQRISSDYVDGIFAWFFRMIHIPAYRCAPCRNRFFSVLRYHRIVPSPEQPTRHHEEGVPVGQ